MLDQILKFLGGPTLPPDADRGKEPRLGIAALLVEAAKSDGAYPQSERTIAGSLLSSLARRRACMVMVALTLFFAFKSTAAELQILTEESPPFSFEVNGSASGWFVDLVREIQRRVKDSNEIHVVPWARAYNLALKTPNVAIFSTVRTVSRERLFDWVGPIDEIELCFFVKSDRNIQIGSIEDAKHLRSIGVTRDSYEDQELTRLGFTNLEKTVTTEQMVKKLLLKRTDAIVSDNNFMLEFKKRNTGISEEIKKSILISKTGLYIAFSLGTPIHIIKSWQKALDDMKADGTFVKFYPPIDMR